MAKEQYFFLSGQKGWCEERVGFKRRFWCGNKTKYLPPSSCFPRPPLKHFLFWDPDEGLSWIWRRILFLDCSNGRRFVQSSHHWGTEILTFHTISLKLSPSANVFNNNNNNNNNNNKRQYKFDIPVPTLNKLAYNVVYLSDNTCLNLK